MILIDTHIWVWWLTESTFLKKEHRAFLNKLSSDDIAISIISVWEVAKAVENKKLQFKISVEQWIALASESVIIIPLDAAIIIDSTKLPDNFHKDPADQLIVATARINQCALLTADEKILSYSHVKHVK